MNGSTSHAARSFPYMIAVVDVRESHRAAGREMVLNTSFNVKGQPIVNTPDEAIATFLDTGIDYLFVENNLISRA